MTQVKLVAKTAVARCPRCFKPILARSPIEQFKTTSSGVAVYAHVGCKPFDLESATKQQMSKIDDDDYQISANSFTVTNGSQSQPLGDTGSEVPFGGSGGDSGNNGNGAGGSGQSGNGNGSGGAGDSGQQAGAMQSQTAPSPNSEAFRRAVESAAAQAAAQAEKNLQPKLQGMLVAAAQSALPVMEKKIRNELTGAAADKVQEMMQFAKEEIAKAVSEMALQIAEEVEKKSEHIVKHVHVIKKEEIETILDENEVYHKCFHEVLELLSAGFNVFLPGPTGCGKTHMSQQVAKALGKRFGMINGSAGTTESELFGTSYPNIATGESHFETTDFLECYENGGLFLFDEGDAMDPNCLLKLNSAIANGFCVVPKRRENRKAVRHKDFSFIMAANTWGTGATRQYCGRNKLDAATLDRFIGGTVPMDYDANVEKRYACPDPTLYAILVGWRQKIIANRFQRILSTRFMRDAYKLSTALNKDITYIAQKLAGGWTSKECVAVFGEDYSTQL